MDFELPEEIRMLHNTVHRFVERELIPIELESTDESGLKPSIREKLEAKASAAGLWLMDVPEEYGGQGLGLLAMTVIWQEMARTIAVPMRGPGILGPEARPLLYHLSPSLKERYLFPLLRGEKKSAFAQTEPDAGADPGSMRTIAVREGDHYVINGNKRFISFAGDADFIQLVAATDRAKGSRGGLSVFIVDASTPGFSVTRKTIKMMGDATYELHFKDMKVPAENRVGEEGEGMRLAQDWITAGRIYQASRGLGVAQRCIELASSYAKQRVTFGAALSERQAVQFMIADMFMRHAMAQTFLLQCAWKADRKTLPRHEAFTAKVVCTELGFFAADRAMQIFGGMGLTTEVPIQKMWKDIRSLMITEGAVEVMRSAVAREVLKRIK